MAINQRELRSDLSRKDAAISAKGIPRSSVNYLCRRSEHSPDLLHMQINENTFVDTSFFRFDLFLCHCLSLLSATLSSNTFQNNQMHCEIIDCYFNVFFVEIHLKKENLKSAFWVSGVGHPNWCTSPPNGIREVRNVHFSENLACFIFLLPTF